MLRKNFGTKSRTIALLILLGPAFILCPSEAMGQSVEETLQKIQALLSSLPSESFKPPAQERRQALTNKLAAIKRQLADGLLIDAIDKLQFDILAKLDGSFGGSSGDDWIISPQAQELIFPVVSDFTAFLRRTHASLAVGPSGGIVAVTDSASPLFGVRVSVPPGALLSDTIITVSEPMVVPTFQNGSAAIVAVQLEPSGLSFTKPVTLEVPYSTDAVSRAGVLNEQFLGLFFYDNILRDWTSLASSSTDTSGKVVSTNDLRHFSLVALSRAQLCRKIRIASPTDDGFTCLAPYTRAGAASQFVPVLLVHGWQHSCGLGGGSSTWDLGPDLLLTHQLDVWDLRYPSCGDIRKSAAILKFALSEVKRQSGVNRVNIIAHSAGGLVARAYIQGLACVRNVSGTVGSCITGSEPGDIREPYNRDINKLFVIGTPHNGASLASLEANLQAIVTGVIATGVAAEVCGAEVVCAIGLAPVIKGFLDGIIDALVNSEFFPQLRPGSPLLGALNGSPPVALEAQGVGYQALSGQSCPDAGALRCSFTGGQESDGFVTSEDSRPPPAFATPPAMHAFHTWLPPSTSTFYCFTIPLVRSWCLEPGFYWSPGLVFIQNETHPVFSLMLDFATALNSRVVPIPVDFVLYDDFESAPINSSKWSPSLEVITPTFVRAIQDGKLVLKNQAPLTGILENGVFMTQLAGLRAIQVDVRLTEVEPPPPGAVNTNSARVLFALYNDGTLGGGVAGDVIADLSLGIGPGSSQVTAFAQLFRCANPSCSSATFRQGMFGAVAELTRTHTLSIIWDGAGSVRFGFDGATRILDPTELGPVVRPPISGYTGVTVVGVSRAAGMFDNVLVARRTAMDDNFDDNFLDPARWGVLVPPPGSFVTVLETNRQLEIEISPGLGGGGIVSRCSLSSDFDVQVAYVLLNWPAGNRHSARLGAFDLGVGPGGAVGLNRSSFLDEFYLLALPAATHLLSTTDTAGGLRLVRIGNSLSGFFHDGTDWVLVGSGDVPTTSTRINLDLGAGDASALGGIKIAFDNFKVNAGIISCP